MLSKTRLKELCAYRQQKLQDKEGLFIVEGVKMANEALQWGAEVVCICATSEWLEQVDSGKHSAEIYEVTPTELERLSLMRTPNQVWMLVKRVANGKWPAVINTAILEINSKITYRTSNLTLVLDRLQDPGNMGTIMRTADWYGVRHIICSHDTVSCYNSKVVQASMGAIFRTCVEYVDLPRWLADCGQPVYGASLQGEKLSSIDLQPSTPKVLIIGNESRGISPETMEQVSHPVLIPNRGGSAESLNAAVAAAILMDRLVGEL